MAEAEHRRAPVPPRRVATLKRNRARRPSSIAFLVFVFDQATKWVVTYPLNLQGQPEQTIEITLLLRPALGRE